MHAIRRLFWLPLLFGAIVGCGSGEVSAPSPSITPAVGAPKAPPAPSKKSPEEMLPPPAKTEVEKAAPSKKDEPPAIEGPKSEATAPSAIKLSSEEIEIIKKLPSAEQTLALSQVVCPVSGEPLGAMGIPKKTSALGRTFYLCCGGCEDTVTSDPKSVLAKLDKK